MDMIGNFGSFYQHLNENRLTAIKRHIFTNHCVNLVLQELHPL